MSKPQITGQDFTTVLTPLQIMSAQALGIDLAGWNQQIVAQVTQWLSDAYQQPLFKLALEAYAKDPNAASTVSKIGRASCRERV